MAADAEEGYGRPRARSAGPRPCPRGPACGSVLRPWNTGRGRTPRQAGCDPVVSHLRSKRGRTRRRPPRRGCQLPADRPRRRRASGGADRHRQADRAAAAAPPSDRRPSQPAGPARPQAAYPAGYLGAVAGSTAPDTSAIALLRPLLRIDRFLMNHRFRRPPSGADERDAARTGEWELPVDTGALRRNDGEKFGLLSLLGGGDGRGSLCMQVNRCRARRAAATSSAT
jgi:hypothetical protein